MALLAVVILMVHERGLRALNATFDATATHVSRRRRMWLSYAGIAVATLSVVSPLQYWSMEYFWVHMIQHVTVMLAAPALYVAGAPAIPLAFALPVTTRRRLLRWVFLRPGRPMLRRVGAVLFSPTRRDHLVQRRHGRLDGAERLQPRNGQPKLHIGLMLSSFFISGLLFWLQFIPSRPWRPTLTPFARVGVLLFTNLVMTIIAMSISFFASGAVYDIGNSMLHMANMAIDDAHDPQSLRGPTDRRRDLVGVRRLLVLPGARDGASARDQERDELERHGRSTAGTSNDDRRRVPSDGARRERHLAQSI